MNSEISNTFGRVVRRYREKLDLSQEALAERAGIHRTYISAIELGKVRLGLDIAKKLATGLDVPLHRLIEEAEESET